MKIATTSTCTGISMTSEQYAVEDGRCESWKCEPEDLSDSLSLSLHVVFEVQHCDRLYRFFPILKIGREGGARGFRQTWWEEGTLVTDDGIGAVCGYVPSVFLIWDLRVFAFGVPFVAFSVWLVSQRRIATGFTSS